MAPPPQHAAAKDADEVEVKLRLPDAAAASAAADAILGGTKHAKPTAVRATLAQENYFFDGEGGELGQQRCVLRLRFASSSAADGAKNEETAVLTLKGQQVLDGGIGVARELEAPLPDARAARRYLQEPGLMVEEVLRVEGRGDGGAGGPAAEVLRALEATEHGRAALAHLRCLGGFRNTRREVPWEFFVGGGEDGVQDRPTESALVELDETAYEWGTVYELEAEAPGAAAAEQLRDALERALGEKGVSFSRSTVSKFRNFVRRTLE